MYKSLILAVFLLPPFTSCAISREERIQEIEREVFYINEKRLDIQMLLMECPFMLSQMSEKDKEEASKEFAELDKKVILLYRELVELIIAKK